MTVDFRRRYHLFVDIHSPEAGLDTAGTAAGAMPRMGWCMSVGPLNCEGCCLAVALIMPSMEGSGIGIAAETALSSAALPHLLLAMGQKLNSLSML